MGIEFIGKSILVLGAGFGQLPAIRKAKELGLKVYTADMNIDAVGAMEADSFFHADISDPDAILRLARVIQPNAIMTMQSDIGVLSVGTVVDDLGLAGVSLETAVRCTNKIDMRKRFAECQVAQPDYTVVDSFVALENAVRALGFPCVVKCPDSSGSRGIVKVDAAEGLIGAYNSAMEYSKCGLLLVEQFINGIEIGAQTFSRSGKCELVLFHDDEVSSPPFMVPIGHSYPCSVDAAVLNEAKTIVQNAVEALGIYEGPSNVDLILDNAGKVYILEIGARIGATCLPELTELYSGIDWVGATIHSALGFSPDLLVKKFQPCAAVILKSPKDGIFVQSSINLDSTEKANLVELEITAALGDKVSKLRKGTDRIGKVLSIGSSAREAIDNANAIVSRVNIIVE